MESNRATEQCGFDALRLNTLAFVRRTRIVSSSFKPRPDGGGTAGYDYVVVCVEYLESGVVIPSIAARIESKVLGNLLRSGESPVGIKQLKHK